jgi:hypothetical protein
VVRESKWPAKRSTQLHDSFPAYAAGKSYYNREWEKKIITKLEAAMKQVVNQAASGDLRAFSEVKAMAISVEQSANQDMTEQQQGLNELDQKAVLNILKRYNTTAGGSTEDEKGSE